MVLLHPKGGFDLLSFCFVVVVHLTFYLSCDAPFLVEMVSFQCQLDGLGNIWALVQYIFRYVYEHFSRNTFEKDPSGFWWHHPLG